MYAEAKIDDTWRTIEAPRGLDSYNDERGNEPDWYASRSYTEFALLADVRNREPELNRPIKEATHALPLDASAEVAADFKDSDRGPWSFYTLRELLEYDWNTPIWSTGYMPAKAYIDDVEANGSVTDPDHCLGNGCYSHNRVEVNKRGEELALSLTQLKLLVLSDHSKEFYVWTRTARPAKEACSYIHDTLILALQKLGEPDDVRIIFSFDG